jgi:uncharacterized protein (TIGR02145 family)
MKKIIPILAVIILFAACNESSTPDPGTAPTTTVTKESSTPDTGTAPKTTVTIGTQVWMLKNLDVSIYKNGDTIPQVTDPEAWASLTNGAWCYYDNDSSQNATYGKLYNWYAVADPRGLAPAGYHIPSDAEWTTLSMGLGGDLAEGGKMKETGTTHWTTPNTGATNSSGFTGLPGGNRIANGSNGPFFDVGVYGYWWSSTESSPTHAWYRYLLSTVSSITHGNNFSKNYGFSVRCLRD